MSKERELLERAIDEWDSDRDLYEFHKVMEEIRAYLAEPEPTQEPIGYVITIDPDKSYRKDSWVPWKEVEGMNGGKIRDDIPDGSFVYLHPAPRPEFVRLSEEEVNSLTYAPYEPYELICAVENRLVEKNRG